MKCQSVIVAAITQKARRSPGAMVFWRCFRLSGIDVLTSFRTASGSDRSWSIEDGRSRSLLVSEPRAVATGCGPIEDGRSRSLLVSEPRAVAIGCGPIEDG